MTETEITVDVDESLCSDDHERAHTEADLVMILGERVMDHYPTLFEDADEIEIAIGEDGG